MRWRLLDNNPLRAVEVPKVRNERKPEVLTLEEAAQYLGAFEDHVLEPIVVLALAAGLRRSELAGLRWSDLRFWKETGEDGVVTELGEVSVAREHGVSGPFRDWSRGHLEPSLARTTDAEDRLRSATDLEYGCARDQVIPPDGQFHQ